VSNTKPSFLEKLSKKKTKKLSTNMTATATINNNATAKLKHIMIVNSSNGHIYLKKIRLNIGTTKHYIRFEENENVDDQIQTLLQNNPTSFPISIPNYYNSNIDVTIENDGNIRDLNIILMPRPPGRIKRELLREKTWEKTEEYLTTTYPNMFITETFDGNYIVK
jgi:hypothetical protein